jgi:predicted RNA binding protein YcfA (HicA-like mRNA interferase family)
MSQFEFDPIKPKTLEKILSRLEFQKAFQKKGHAFYRHEDGRMTTVPRQPGRMIAPPLLKEILRDIEVDTCRFKEFLEELEKK